MPSKRKQPHKSVSVRTRTEDATDRSTLILSRVTGLEGPAGFSIGKTPSLVHHFAAKKIPKQLFLDLEHWTS